MNQTQGFKEYLKSLKMVRKATSDNLVEIFSLPEISPIFEIVISTSLSLQTLCNPQADTESHTALVVVLLSSSNGTFLHLRLSFVTLTFLKNGGHLFDRMSVDLDLPDFYLMKRYR